MVEPPVLRSLVARTSFTKTRESRGVGAERRTEPIPSVATRAEEEDLPALAPGACDESK
jgi:hypothetical protein